jgi:carboxymethylenebutenolidase
MNFDFSLVDAIPIHIDGSTIGESKGSYEMLVMQSRGRLIMYQTDMYEGLLAETVTLHGYHHEVINGYFARPLGPGPFPGLVLAHHIPGWDEWYKETARKFAHHGFATLCPNLYYRAGHGSPEDVAAKVRGAGGIPDDQAVGDLEGAMLTLRALPQINGKIGIFGTCSGGRHSYLTACRVKGFDAAVDCWGARVVTKPDELTPFQPVAPLDYTKDLSCPLLGIFGEEDQGPTPEQVARHEEELKKFGRAYEFHMYPKAGHGFFYYNKSAYRQEQAVEGWKKVFEFLEKNLETPRS